MSVQGTVSASTAGPATAQLVCHIGPRDLEEQLRRDALEGLSGQPKSIPSKWFYDYAGSMLFDQITRLPEYYLTRCEQAILEARRRQIVEETGAQVLAELGCGLSEKTKVLLDAFVEQGMLRRFIPFDVDGEVLKTAAAELLDRYPGLEVSGIVGDFERHLGAIAVEEPAIVIFLGSTIGNLDRLQRSSLLCGVADSLKPGDHFLLGVDLVKDVATIEAAYNDSAGISAAFNLNMLNVLNCRLGGNFEVGRFEHVARFNPETEQMEMFLKSTTSQTVILERIGLEVGFAEHELLHTEISAKFRREGIEAELRDAGLTPRRWWTDADENFGVSLSAKP